MSASRRLIIEISRPSLRLLLLCRSDFLDLIEEKRDGRGNTAKPYGDHAVVAYSRDGSGEKNATAFFNLSHNEYLARAAQEARP